MKKNQIVDNDKQSTSSKKISFDMDKINSIISKVKKMYGEDSVEITKAADFSPTYISSGISILDKYTNGIAEGGTILLYGPMSSGKTTHAAKIVANAQQQGKRCVWVDQEGKFEIQKEWIKKLGVDLDKLIVVRGTYWEANADVVINLVANDLVDFVVVDSVAAISPKAEKTESPNKGDEIRELTASTVGLIARQMSKFSRFISSDIAMNRVTMLFISQVRADVSLVSTGRTKSIPQGGNAILHMANLIIRVTEKKGDPDSTIKDENDVPVLWRTEYKIEKNHQTGIDNIVVDVICKRDYGPSDIDTLIYYAMENDIITRNGGYYIFDSLKVRGWDNFIKSIHSDPDLQNKLVEVIKEKI